MKIHLYHNDNSTLVTFGRKSSNDWRAPSFYFVDKEMEDEYSYEGKLVINGFHKAWVTRTTILLFDTQLPLEDGPFKLDANLFYCDTHKLLRTILHLRKLHLKKVETWVAAGNKDYLFKQDLTELNLERFRMRDEDPPKMTFSEIVNHVNVVYPDKLSKAIVQFRDTIREELWPKFVRDLMRYVRQANIYGQVGEIYFDGRHTPGQCGYNGSLILHGDSYGIHT